MKGSFVSGNEKAATRNRKLAKEKNISSVNANVTVKSVDQPYMCAAAYMRLISHLKRHRLKGNV